MYTVLSLFQYYKPPHGLGVMKGGLV